jgi:hypothetical protein
MSAPFIIDPSTVFHYKKIRDNGVEPNKKYIKMRSRLNIPVNNPALFNSYLCGSSRVSFIYGSNIDINCDNLTYSDGVSAEQFKNLKIKVEPTSIPVTVIVGIANISCLVPPESHQDQLLLIPPPPPPSLAVC